MLIRGLHLLTYVSNMVGLVGYTLMYTFICDTWLYVNIIY